MDKYTSSFSNCTPPVPGLNPCQPVAYLRHFSKQPLNFGLSIYAPVSSVPGSASFFFLQPLLTGKVFASIVVLIAAQTFLYIADHLWGLESRSLKNYEISPEQTVQMSLSDLQDFLASMSQGAQSSTTDSASATTAGQDISSTITTQTPEIPLVIAITVWSDYSNQPFGPTVFLIVPLFTLPGARGALPILILELLTTIFVRSVVPPQTTGSKPLTDPPSNNRAKLLQFSPEDLLNLLNRFSKHFGS